MATLVYRPSAAWKQKAYSKNTTMRGHGRIQNRSREPFLINTLLGEGANREDQTYLIRSLVYQERLFLRLSLFAFAQSPSSLLVLSRLATSVVHCLVCAASQEAVTPSSSLCFFSTYIYTKPFRSTDSVHSVAMAWFEAMGRTEKTILEIMGDKRAQLKSRQTDYNNYSKGSMSDGYTT